jgi:hypothetical protein
MESILFEIVSCKFLQNLIMNHFPEMSKSTKTKGNRNFNLSFRKTILLLLRIRKFWMHWIAFRIKWEEFIVKVVSNAIQSLQYIWIKAVCRRKNLNKLNKLTRLVVLRCLSNRFIIENFFSWKYFEFIFLINLHY